MMKPAVLLSLCFALPSLASPIVRTADVSLPGFGTYKVELSVDSQSVGRITSAQANLRAGDSDVSAACSTSTHLTGPVLTYKLKDARGTVIATVAQATDIENLAQTAINSDGSCPTRSIVNSVTNFFHADQFADFTVRNASGAVAQISFSTFFNGALNIASDGSDQATVDANSLVSLRYFFNNQGGGTTQLSDPAAPPAPPYDPATDSGI